VAHRLRELGLRVWFDDARSSTNFAIEACESIVPIASAAETVRRRGREADRALRDISAIK
jgi:hypothetical protein